MVKTTNHLSIAQIERAMRLARGNITLVARALERSRAGIYKRISDSPHLQQVKEDILEEEIDLREGKLRTMGFDQNNVTALLAWLNANAKHRGYGRQNLDVRGSLEHDHKHVHTKKKTSDLTAEEATSRWRELTGRKPRQVN
jgi:hypothetical protein